MRCPSCRTDNPADASFCEQCGAKLELVCPACKTAISPGARFCKKCGTAITSGRLLGKKSDDPPIRVAEISTLENLDGERKTVTALFADIKGSTELERDLDPEEARAIVDPVLQLMMAAVHNYDGYVAQSTGDGIFALFGAPVAHEDHAQRALHAALAMQQELRQHGERLRSQNRSPVGVRIGVNTGEVVMRTIQTGGHSEYTPVGHVTNLAARMQTVAPIDGIAIGEDTRRLVEGYFELRALGPTPVKGVAEPINVFEVIGKGPLRGHFELATRRGLTRFVGRERELTELQRVLELARSGHGQVVAVVAEAGTGKSRLVYEFKATISGDCEVLEAYSVSHGRVSAWLPVLELLRSYFWIEGHDDPSKRREKLRARLGVLDSKLNDTLPYLFGLLGIQENPDPLAQMDSQIRRRRILEMLKRIILSEALKHPIVVIFEDLHWIDSESQGLLDLLADSIANSRVLLLVNYRPEYRHEWANKSYYSQLRLEALGAKSADAMMTALLGDASELAGLRRMIIERAEGNPFFVEEIVQALFDEGVLVRNGAVKVARPLSQIQLPQTVQGILAARIDRLPSEHKQLLQRIAVVGLQAPLSLIRRLTSVAESQVERVLAELQSGEFIYERPLAADLEYVFKHTLTQEVAYNSILIERRKRLHERAGQALESIFAEQLDDHLVELARHYSHSDNVIKAIEYLGRAGQQAVRRSLYSQAIRNLGSAIELLQKVPEPTPEQFRLEVQLEQAIGPALIAVNGWGSEEMGRNYTRMHELCTRLRNPPEFFRALYGVWLIHYTRAEMPAALNVAKQLLQQAEATRNREMLGMAHHSLGTTLFHTGQLISARAHIEISLSFDTPLTGEIPTDLTVSGLSYRGHILSQLGYADQALKSSNEAVARAQALSHAHSVVEAFSYNWPFQLERGEIACVQSIAERMLTISTEHGLIDFAKVALLIQGLVLVSQGNKEGISQIEECVSTTRMTGTKMYRPGWLCLVAWAYTRFSRFQEASRALDEAMVIAEVDGARYQEPEIFRLRAELLLKQDGSNIEPAQDCFQHAISVARRLSAKLFELRATSGLARLLARQGRRDEARATLAEIYNSFSEGFDTVDLKTAKALLDELND